MICMLVELLMSLRWQSVLVLHDLDLDPLFLPSLEEAGISYINYDISIFIEEHPLTFTEDLQLQQDLNVLLFCDITTTVSFLRQYGLCDKRPKTKVDFCHQSRVLIVGSRDYLDPIVDGNTQVENMAVLEIPGRNERFIEPKLWTQVIHPHGRAVTDVPLSRSPVTNMTEVFPNVKFGFNGRQLKVVMKKYSWEHGSVRINNYSVSGLKFTILQNLALSLNFSFKVIPPREDEWGRNINGSWTGVLGMLQRQEVDLSMDLLTIHSDRQDAADFILPPALHSKFTILYKKESNVDEDNLMVFLRPVLPTTIILFGVSVVLVTVSLSFLRFSQHHHNQSQRTAHHNMTETMMARIMSSLFDVYGASLKQGSSFVSSKGSERILLASWWIFTTIFSAVYCGTIMATLAVRTETRPFNNMAELAARDDYKIGYDAASVTHHRMEESRQLDVVAVRQRVLDESVSDPDVLSSNLTKHLQNIENGKYAFLTHTVVSDYLIRNKCSLKAIDSTFGTSYDAVYVPKSSPFKHELQNRISLLTDSGIMQEAVNKWLQSIPEDKCPIEELHKPVALIQLKGIFYALGIGMGCSVLGLMAEVVCVTSDFAGDGNNT
ncbi:probable glutamate receptor [Haliotis asinina]|uniref:probable glutamate receptor n=1 Tax=Haliotis asinina TaxID=109174 RepID=UPI003531A7FF